MANQQPQTVSIDGKEYEIDKLSDRAKLFIDHVADLDRKINSTRFQLDQMQIGRDAAFGMLKTELEAKPEVEEVN